GPLEEVVQALVAEVTHPLRLALHLRDLFHDLVREAFASLEDVVLGLAEAPLILFELDADIRLRAHVSASIVERLRTAAAAARRPASRTRPPELTTRSRSQSSAVNSD